ncbi:MAG TPA: hypothetical protein DCX06_07490 [Opitutae bacterium]|nr:hypothetical protein [Opitutae bacterium]
MYKSLADQIRTLGADIEKLDKLSREIDGNLRGRVENARQWMESVVKAPVTPNISATDLDQAILTLEGCEVGETSNALSHVASTADTLCKQLREHFASDAGELRKLRNEKSELKPQIDALKRGLPPVPQPLLHALKEALPTLPGQPAAQALRELCEVTDESWRAAIEVAFTEKFAVVVSDENYAQALEILHQMKAADSAQPGTPTQTLIRKNTFEAINYKTQNGSLASKIRTTSELARAVIDEWFGNVICVTNLESFEKHDSAILPDGLLARGTMVQRARHYDGLPFVGEEGLKRQLKSKLAQFETLEAGIRRLEPLEREIDRIIDDRNQKIPEHVSVSENLIRIETLPRLQSKHKDLNERLQAIDSSAFKKLEQEAETKKEQIADWKEEELEIARKGAEGKIKDAERNLKQHSEGAEHLEDEFLSVKLNTDISSHLEQYRTWKEEMIAQFPADALSKKFGNAANVAEKIILQTIGDLKLAMLDFKKTFQPKFDDLPEDEHGTAAYERLLSSIENANIPEYERKSALEQKRWNGLFRTQVLSRMQQAIKKVENIISLLNQQLKRPIGHDRYKIERRHNPDFKFYRELIDLNSLHHEDELFFASIDDDLQDALDAFLQTLVKNANSPEASRLLDYRQYFDYDLLVSDVRDLGSKPVSVDKQSGKMSGGENQSPYFVAILASYLHAYNRHETRWKEPSLALVPIDEAFSKLSGERIQDCLKAMAELDLQGMFSMSSGNIPYAFSLCDELIIITKKEERRGTRVGVRNIPSVLFSDSDEGRACMKESES